MKPKRSLRVAEIIKREISVIITQKVKNPVVKSLIITHVILSDDLKYTKIYYQILGKKYARDDVKDALSRVEKFIRMELGHRTDLRYVPEIHFFYDEKIDHANRIDYLLDKIKQDQS